MSTAAITPKMLDALRVADAEGGAVSWSAFDRAGLVSQFVRARKRKWIAEDPAPPYVTFRLWRLTAAGRAILAEHGNRQAR